MNSSVLFIFMTHIWISHSGWHHALSRQNHHQKCLFIRPVFPRRYLHLAVFRFLSIPRLEILPGLEGNERLLLLSAVTISLGDVAYWILLRCIETGFGEGFQKFNTEVAAWKDAQGKTMVLRTKYAGKLQINEEEGLEDNSSSSIDPEYPC